jgi:O-antigen ligase/tetratricopeptide (TPR) repeat protein
MLQCPYMNTSRIAPVLRNIVLGGAFLMPFIVFVFSSQTFFPYVFGKNIAFRVVVEVMFFAWVALAFLDARYRPKKSAILYAVLSFTGIIGIATVFSFDLVHSFWSTFERMEGYVTILHLAAYFLALTSVMMAEKIWTWLFRVMLGVSVVVGMGGLAQLSEVNRISGILGNSEYLGAYGMLHAGLALFLLVRPGIPRMERYVYGALAFFNLWVMYNTGTRGAMLGFMAGAFLAAIVYVVFARAQEYRHSRKIAGGVIALLLVLGGVFFAMRDSSFVMENRVLRRFASISLEDKSTRARLITWNLAVEGWLERPILGWGQENFDYVFLKYYDPRMYDQEPFFDRVHNIFLDWLIAGGVLGLLGYLSLYGAALFVLWKSDMSVGEKSVLLGLIIGYGAQNFFVFDTITSYIVFYTLLGYIAVRGYSDESRGDREPVTLPERYATAALVAVGVVGLGVLYGVNASAITANTAIIDVKRISASTEKEAALASIYTATHSASFARAEASERAAEYVQKLLYADLRPSDDMLASLIASVKEELDAFIDVRPLNPRPYYVESVFLANVGEMDEAISRIDEAVARSPKKVQFVLFKALLHQRNGDSLQAEKAARIAYDLVPENPLANLVLVNALFAQEKYDEAHAMIMAFPEDMRIADKELAQRCVDAGDYEAAVRIWRDVVEDERKRDTLDVGTLISYASLFANAGNHDAARGILEEAITLFPEDTERLETFIGQL